MASDQALLLLLLLLLELVKAKLYPQALHSSKHTSAYMSDVYIACAFHMLETPNP
jgi:hypothetical protein